MTKMSNLLQYSGRPLILLGHFESTDKSADGSPRMKVGQRTLRSLRVGANGHRSKLDSDDYFEALNIQHSRLRQLSPVNQFKDTCV